MTGTIEATGEPAPPEAEAAPLEGLPTDVVSAPHGRHRGRQLREHLPLRDRIARPMPDDGRWGWGGPLLVTAVAGFLRFTGLGSPHVFSFDETYYAKDGLSLLRYGYEQESVGNANDQILAGHSHVFTGFASYVVHPPVGKWLIGSGEGVFGATPFGWRFVPAVFGTLMVLMLARIVRRMTHSTLLGCIAGLLLALDGLAIVMSRSALLDGFLAFFILAAFGCLVLDRDHMRTRLAGWAADHPPGTLLTGDYGPKLGLRTLRIAAGLLLGLACATKWSGIYFIFAFGAMTVLWDLGARRAAGIRSPYLATLVRDAITGFFSIVPTALAVYCLAWVPWLLTFSHQKRNWVLNRRGFSFFPDNIRALMDYHVQMWHFHLNLDSPHPYAGKAIGWLLLVRPTAFWSIELKPGQQGCKASQCTREVTSLGTPVLWWAASAALVWLLWRWVGGRDWRAGAVLGAVAAGWLPWVIFYRHRTIFTFYEIAFEPFMIMALTFALGAIIGARDASPTRRTWGAATVGGYLLLVVANTAWIWPLLTGQLLSQSDWLRRLWFRGWI